MTTFERAWFRLALVAAGTSVLACVLAAAWLTYRLTRLEAYVVAFGEALNAAGVAHESLQIVALRDARTLAWLMAVVAPAAIIGLFAAIRWALRSASVGHPTSGG